MAEMSGGQAAERDDMGLEGRYRVEKINDPTGKHDACRYFVLDPQHDVLALQALKFYARLARGAGYFALADDLDQWTHDETERLSQPHATPSAATEEER